MRSTAPRPLTARSIIASTLLGTHPPRLPGALLVKSCELFGVRENATRVALTRMVASGELTVESSRYELVGRLRERQSRQDLSRRGLDGDMPWDTTWRLAVVNPEPRSAANRAELRRLLALTRFSEWREGLWARPDNLPMIAPPIAGCTEVAGARPPDPRGLAARIFPLSLWAERAQALITEIERTQRRLRPGVPGALAESFVLNATTLRHFQADPLLPGPLLPSRWPGGRLRARYEEFDQTFQAVWREHLRSEAQSA